MSRTIENPNIRISALAKATLRELARQEGKPMQAVLDEAIEHYQRERLLDEANAAYARLKSDPKAWQEELAERKQWDVTLADGLEKE
jgi:predicted DNA-binding protein